LQAKYSSECEKIAHSTPPHVALWDESESKPEQLPALLAAERIRQSSFESFTVEDETELGGAVIRVFRSSLL
jgi:hypothetical protein